MIIFSENVKEKDLDKSLINLIKNFNTIVKDDIPASSGKRSIEKNKEVGGVPNSSHLKGLAIDLVVKDSQTRLKVIFGALAGGFKRIGIGKTHIHLDCDKDKPQNIIFFDGI